MEGGGSGSRAPLILNLGIRQRLVVSLKPRPLYPHEKFVEQDARWAAQPVRTV